MQYKHNINVHIVGNYSINLYSLQNRKVKLARQRFVFLPILKARTNKFHICQQGTYILHSLDISTM